MSGTRRKFRPGEPVKSIDELVERLGRHEWMYLNHKPLHPAFLGNMGFWTLLNYLRRHMILTAISGEGIKE